jgi:hypothetical protein
MSAFMWVAASAVAIIVGIAGGLLFARDATLVAIPGDRYVLLLVVAMLVLVGAAVTAVRRPPDRGALVGAATFTFVSLALGGALAGYLLAPAHRTIDSEHVIATASAGVHATFEGSAVVGGDAGAGECHSRPGSKEVGEIVTDELGATSAGPLHAVLIPLGSDAGLQLWVETDQKPQLLWMAQPTVELGDKLATSGRATFTDARIGEDVDTSAFPDLPRSLTGTIEWTCGPWDVAPSG